MTPFVTPNADFYRIDTALIAPQVRTADYTLQHHTAWSTTRSSSPTTTCSGGR